MHNGINDEIDNDCTVSYGYDGGIAESKMTQEEKIELADYMIELWGKYKKHSANK